VAALMLCAWVLPAAAVAQPSNPLSPGLPQESGSAPSAPTPTVVPTPTTSTAGDSGISGSGALVIAIGALVVLGGISLFIWRDARRRAPVRAHHAHDAPEGGRQGSKAKTKP